MRLASRILVVGAVAFGPAVVALLGCGVDMEGTLPGLPNQIPNVPGGGVGSIGAGTGGSSTTTSTSTGSTSGGPVTPCGCAAASQVAGSTCATCFNASDGVAGSMGCGTQFVNCGSTCKAQIQCLTTCDGGAACIDKCITNDATYEALLLCQCNLCASQCQMSTPVMCAIGLDGGSTLGDAGDAGDSG